NSGIRTNRRQEDGGSVGNGRGNTVLWRPKRGICGRGRSGWESVVALTVERDHHNLPDDLYGRRGTVYSACRRLQYYVLRVNTLAMLQPPVQILNESPLRLLPYRGSGSRAGQIPL